MKPFHHSFEAIGTTWVIDVYDEMPPNTAEKLNTKIHQRIEEFDKTYSRFRKDSLVGQMSQHSGNYDLPADSIALFELYEKLYHLTDGAFTPLIGNVLEEAGYDAEYSLKPKTLHTPLSWSESFEFHNQQINMKQPAVLDFGAAGKGYLVDLVSDLIKANGFSSFCVDGSGDLFYQHSQGETLRVGLEHPANDKQVIGIAEIVNQSICGSAGNRRKWQNFHHIIDPHTLTSPTDKLAVWVVASTALLADALTTCLFFVSPETLSSDYDFEYAVVNSDYSLKKSVHFPGEFFS
jgi:thiamine biosynthesis lipoprotein